MEISNLTKNEQTDYLLMYGLKSSGLDQLIKLAYKMLGLETFFTAGEKEIKAWTIKKDLQHQKRQELYILIFREVLLKQKFIQ